MGRHRPVNETTLNNFLGKRDMHMLIYISRGMQFTAPTKAA